VWDVTLPRMDGPGDNTREVVTRIMSYIGSEGGK